MNTIGDRATQLKMANPESKYWVFTYWCKPELTEEKTIDAKYPKHPKFGDDYKTERSVRHMTYLRYQEEVGEECGRDHLQGYVEFDAKVARNWLKKTFDDSIHWEVRKGSAVEADEYASKEDTRKDGGFAGKFGTISKPEPGKRNDLLEVANRVKAGSTLKRIAEEFPVEVIKFHRGITTLIDLTMRAPPDIPKTVIVLYGGAGTGKSSWARKFFSDNNFSFYCPAMNNSGVLSFESYGDQEWLWLDDFAYGALTAQALKLLTDRYPCQLPGRGSSRWAQHRGVVITSNYSIDQWYPASPMEVPPLIRRCTEYWEVDKEFWTWMLPDCFGPHKRPNPMREFLH